MKVMMYILRGLFILGLMLPTFVAAQSTGAEAISRNDDMNALVVTFSPPFAGSLNRSEKLFQALIETMQEKPGDLAGKINSVGAIWSASQNLNGVQFALFYPGDSAAATDICRSMLTGLAGRIPEIQAISSSKDFSHYLHSICQCHCSFAATEANPVSVYATGLSSESYDLLKLETGLFSSLYDRGRSKQKLPAVIPETPATAYEVFSWNRFTAETFFSAKFIGEAFIKEMHEIEGCSYEIFNCDGGIQVALLTSGSEEKLFHAHNKLRQFARLSFPKNRNEAWKAFSDRLKNIINDDERDLTKKNLFAAWVKHWSGNFTDLANNPGFVAPTARHSGVSQPEPWNHKLSFSKNIHPRFCASSYSENNDTVDISLGFSGEKDIIDLIEQILDSERNTSFPMNIDRRVPDRLSLSFHCKPGQVVDCVSRLRLVISGGLFENGIEQRLASLLKVGIAANGNMPPFELRGLLQQGWPPVTDEHEWQMVTASDLPALLLFSTSDNKALKRRWAIAISTSRGKTEILSLLALQNMALRDINLF